MIARMLTSKYALVAGVLVSGLAYFYGNGLVGTYGYLLWLAPVPILCLAWYHSSKMTFLIAFLAGFVGRLSWFVYLKTVANLPMAVIFTIGLALAFAGIITLTRRAVLRTNSWMSVLAFPALSTTFEWVQFSVSADATSASMAYTQLDNLPLIQIAAVAGILGITFVVTLIPSAIALAIYFLLRNRDNHEADELKAKLDVTIQPELIINSDKDLEQRIDARQKAKREAVFVCLFSGMLIAGVFVFGFFRLANTAYRQSLNVGLVVIPEELHNMTHRPEPGKDEAATAAYLKQIDALATQGAQVVVLPERALVLHPGVEKRLLGSLARIAGEKQIYIIAGYTNLKAKQDRNSALVIDPAGKILADYHKVHLVTGWEREFAPGKEIGLFQLGKLPSAIAICKDLDFQSYIRQYGQQGVKVLFVPAWDFKVDDWLHSRMAILRGVENGFSIVRTARTGSLTISDRYGRVTAEASTAEGQAASLIAEVDLEAGDTVYSKTGDWPGVLSLLLVVAFMVYSFIPGRNLLGT
jgi:apolipoprotein N-acyltransferase